MSEPVRLYCSCGAAWTGRLQGYDTAPLLSVWRLVHSGARHRPVTAAQANEARKGQRP